MAPPQPNRSHPGIRRLALALWCGAMLAIVIGSLAPFSAGPGHGDLIFLHIVAYTVLSGLTWPAFSTWQGPPLLYGTFALLVLGIVLEVAQPLTGRVLSPADAVANTVGVAFGIPIARPPAYHVR